MPLVKIFARQVMTKPIPLSALQQKLCDIWGTKPNTMKLMLQRVEDWTDESFQEDCYVDIRAYGKKSVTKNENKRPTIYFFFFTFGGDLFFLVCKVHVHNRPPHLSNAVGYECGWLFWCVCVCVCVSDK